MQNKSCPISLESVDATVVRINSFYVGFVFILFILSSEPLVLLFLLAEFITRIFINKNYTPLVLLSKATKNFLALQTNLVDNAPKKLASYFGLIFIASILFTTLIGANYFAYGLSLVLGICIFLEVTFSYCLGCEVYHLYKKFSL